MKMSKQFKYQHRLQQIIFYLLLLVVIIAVAILSNRYTFESDWTANQRHTLSASTTEFLRSLDSPVSIEVFISPGNQYQQAAENLLNRYQQHSSLLNITYIDPVTQPQRVRELAIQQQAEMVVTGQQGQQHVFDLSEQSLSNAIIKVSRSNLPKLVFITGHGERDIVGDAAFDMAQWRNQLTITGFDVQSFSMSEAIKNISTDDNVVLVIASSQKPWPEIDVVLLNDYLQQGGNLLWLSEPDTDIGLNAISEQLNLGFVPGTMVDPNAAKLGLEDPRFVIVTDYANHPVTAATSSVTLMPGAHAMQLSEAESAWQVTQLMQSQSDSWSKLADINPTEMDSLQFDEDLDIPGPLMLSVLLEKNLSVNQKQRVAVFGDGDFVSNLYLGTAANLELAMALVNWLVAEDDSIQIPLIRTRDNQLVLSDRQSLMIGIGFLVLLPVSLLLIGLCIWWVRRRR
ncbi:mucin 2 [Methylophaga sp. SB9B]|uniref:GldG family protein n=1 Tax=Methylophaga sp. SB9B TaxID=2570356 RepID=UPI0010A949DC|nr:GldG family protein [Methylophaga sp. SB9B]THK42515.1 mucin 2 [Methylophaga sp. SB9B]